MLFFQILSSKSRIEKLPFQNPAENYRIIHTWGSESEEISRGASTHEISRGSTQEKDISIHMPPTETYLGLS